MSLAAKRWNMDLCGPGSFLRRETRVTIVGWSTPILKKEVDAGRDGFCCSVPIRGATAHGKMEMEKW